MVFKLLYSNRRIFRIFALLYLALSGFFIVKILLEKRNDLLIFVAPALALLALFMLSFFISNKAPEIVVHPDGIFLVRRLFGGEMARKRISKLDKLYISFKRDEVRLYSLRRLFFFRRCRLVIVDAERAGRLKKMFHPAIETFLKFTDEILKRTRQAEISQASFESLKEVGIIPGINVTVNKGFSLKKERSVLDEFMKKIPIFF